MLQKIGGFCEMIEGEELNRANDKIPTPPLTTGLIGKLNYHLSIIKTLIEKWKSKLKKKILCEDFPLVKGGKRGF